MSEMECNTLFIAIAAAIGCRDSFVDVGGGEAEIGARSGTRSAVDHVAGAVRADADAVLANGSFSTPDFLA